MVPGDTINIAISFLTAHPNWYIFPIQRLKKYPPCIANNLELASNDILQIRKWHASYRGCNWGLSLKKSRAIVIDVDTKPGKVGMDTWEELIEKHGSLPPTFIVRTPSGGWHFYFEEANGVSHRCLMGENGFGLDVDSPNYVLLPGCALDTGGTYEAINDEPVAPAPEWFGGYLREASNTPDADQEAVVELDSPQQVEWSIDYLKNYAKPSIQGQNGEYTLLMTAGVLKDHGISETKAIDLLLEYYNPRCEPPWGAFDGPVQDRLDVKVRNSRLYLKQNAPGAFTPAAEFGGDDEPEPENWGEGYSLKTIVVDGKETEVVTFTPSKAVLDARAAIKDAVRDAPGDEAETVTQMQAEAAPVEAEVTAPVEEPWLNEEPAEEPWLKEEPDPEELDLPAAEEGSDDTPELNVSMIPLDEIDESVKPDYTIHKKRAGKPWNALAELCNRWVWVVGIKRFVNRVNPTLTWEGTQFDSTFNYLCPKGASSISRYLFKRKDLLRRFDTIAFRPGRGEINGNEYNVWRPSPIKPAKGDTTLWNNHLKYLFPDENDRNAILNWMAWVIQNPTRKPNHALLIIGRETGTGKSWIARVMEQIIGENNTQRPKNSSMGGDFNSWLKDCRLCILEEVMQVGRRENINAMRDLITETSVEVNIKGIPAFKIANYAAMLGITNHTNALPVDDKDRRWFMIETPAQTKAPDEEAAYYAPLLAAVPDEPGMPPRDPNMVPAIYYELLNRDIAAFPLLTKDKAGNEVLVPYSGLSRAPWTLAKETMVELSRSDAETWLYDNAGSGPLSRNVVTVSDIVDAMPATLQRVNHLATSIIPNFLRDRLKGVKHPWQVRLTSGHKIRVWVLHGRYDMLKDRLAQQYEADRKASGKEADSSAVEDFGEV